jgi:hypothetical protein
MPLDVLGGCALGAFIGVRHAFEPDHLAAVSTLVAETPRARSAALLGAVWGLGHTAALLTVGAVLLAARAELSPRTMALAELGVAAMLVLLGLRNLARAARTGGQGPVIEHRHGGRAHRHAAAADHIHVGPWPLALRPLLIGLVHGLAGSGALTALAIGGMASASGALLYMALFGLGSVAGMAAVSGLAGAGMHRVIRGARAQTILTGATGALSLVVGLFWGLPLLHDLLA